MSEHRREGVDPLPSRQEQMCCTRSRQRCAASVRRALGAALLGIAIVPAYADAQQQCRTWASIPGGSSPQRDSIFARCAVDTPARPLPPNALPPSPRVDHALNSQITIVVEADGTVDSAMTRFWMGRDEDLHETLRRWRFQPAVRSGRNVRSGFMLHVVTDARADTLPMRIEWTYVHVAEADTLRGRWVAAPAPPPLTREQEDSVYTAVLRRLVAMRVVQSAYPITQRCVLTAMPDSAAEQRMRTLAARVLPRSGHSDGVAPPGCERSTETPRIVLQRLHRTDPDRVVTHVSGDVLFGWPPGFDGQNWRAWDSRCVATLQNVAVADVACSLMPKWPPLGSVPREPPDVVTTLADGDTLSVTLVATTPDAFRNDTMQFSVREVPAWEAVGWRGPSEEPGHPGHFTVRRADLHPETLAGEHVWLRIYTNPAPADLTPVVFARVGTRWLLHAMNPRGIGAWQFQVGFSGPGTPPSEFRILLTTGAR